MHGGTNKGAPKGEKNGTYRHGLFTADVMQKRVELLELMDEAKDLLAKLSSGGR